MAPDIKHIDALLMEHSLRQSELEDIGQDISKSATPAVIAFIDLADSTAMKETKNAEEWLGIIFEFLRRLTIHIEAVKGTVVKRIGDEVLATFASVEDSEKLLVALKADSKFKRHSYRISLDYGDVYHLQFVDGHPNDPYGSVVDRCARISKLGKPNTAVCTYEYFSKISDGSEYLSMGDFSVKGLKKPVAVYLRSMNDLDAKAYLEPLLTSANSGRSNLDGFKQTGKLLTHADIRSFTESTARPFIASELLNLPRCPLTAQQLIDEREKAKDKDEFDARRLGYLVRWNLRFRSYNVQRDYIHVAAEAPGGRFPKLVTLMLPKTTLEGIRELNEKDEIEVRGVLRYMHMGTPMLDYVEIGLIDKH